MHRSLDRLLREKDTFLSVSYASIINVPSDFTLIQDAIDSSSSGDTIFFSVSTDGSVSCQGGSTSLLDGINYTVACATCVNPSAEYSVIDDCVNGDQFLIDVNITDLGSASSVSISDNQGSAGVHVTQTGVTQMGPYPFQTEIIITVSNDEDVNCVINSSPIQLFACPPENDNCDGAIIIDAND